MPTPPSVPLAAVLRRRLPPPRLPRYAAAFLSAARRYHTSRQVIIAGSQHEPEHLSYTCRWLYLKLHYRNMSLTGSRVVRCRARTGCACPRAMPILSRRGAKAHAFLLLPTRVTSGACRRLFGGGRRQAQMVFQQEARCRAAESSNRAAMQRGYIKMPDATALLLPLFFFFLAGAERHFQRFFTPLAFIIIIIAAFAQMTLRLSIRDPHIIAAAVRQIFMRLKGPAAAAFIFAAISCQMPIRHFLSAARRRLMPPPLALPPAPLPPALPFRCARHFRDIRLILLQIAIGMLCHR